MTISLLQNRNIINYSENIINCCVISEQLMTKVNVWNENNGIMEKLMVEKLETVMTFTLEKKMFKLLTKKNIWINAINHWVSHLNGTQFVILNLNIILLLLNWIDKRSKKLIF